MSRKMLFVALLAAGSILLFACRGTLVLRGNNPHNRLVVKTKHGAAPSISASFRHIADGGRITFRTTTHQPPALRHESRGRSRVGHAWVPGYWVWTGAKWEWAAGCWVTARAGHHWVPGKWHKRGSRWEFTAGYWK